MVRNRVTPTSLPPTSEKPTEKMFDLVPCLFLEQNSSIYIIHKAELEQRHIVFGCLWKFHKKHIQCCSSFKRIYLKPFSGSNLQFASNIR